MAQLKDTVVTGGLSVTGSANINGSVQANDNVTLYSSSGDSPSLIFQRGTTSDTLNDYKIVDSGGYMKIYQEGNSGTSGFTQVAQLTNTGDFSVSTPPASNTTPTVSAGFSPTDSSIKVATDATIASGDKLVIRDTSDSNKMRSSSITFGSSTTQFLANNGTWQTPASMTATTASLTVAGWSNNTQTVNVSGVTASNNVIVSSAPASISVYSSAGVYCSAQGAGTLTFTCLNTPDEAITINIMIFG